MKDNFEPANVLDPGFVALHRDIDKALPDEMVSNANLLVKVMATFDTLTAQHLEAVGVFSMHLAIEIGFDRHGAAIAKLAGRLHDIGKLAISRTLLQKPGPLTAQEWKEIRLHPRYGATTLEGLPALAELAPIVRAHMERIGGNGYPSGIRWDEIPLTSQVVAVADAFHAMTVPRPYARARLPMEAILELQNASGSQFNSDYVTAFAKMLGRRNAVRSIRPQQGA